MYIIKSYLLNYNNFKQLSEKIVNSPSNFRMGFRENLAYIMGMSIFCLNLNYVCDECQESLPARSARGSA